MSLRFVRAGKIHKQRLVLLSVFVAASSLSIVVASSGSAGSPKTEPGYWLASTSGVVNAFGGAQQFGSLSAAGSSPVVGMAPTPDAGGYWLATADGRVYAFGDAKAYGSMAAKALAKPIVGVASTPDGRGYWLFGGDGGVFAFGDAGYYGSAGASHLRTAVVGMAVAPAGHGYLLATSSGSVLRFGAVPVGPAKLASPLGSAVAGVAATPDAKGYWLVTAKGKVMAVGDAHNYGSMSGALNDSIVGIASTATGKGYWLATGDGGVYAFGDAQALGGQFARQVVVAGHQRSSRSQYRISGIALSYRYPHPRYKHHATYPTTTASPTTTSSPVVGQGSTTTTGSVTSPGSSTTVAPTTTLAPTTTTTRATTTTTRATTTTTRPPTTTTTAAPTTTTTHATTTTTHATTTTTTAPTTTTRATTTTTAAPTTTTAAAGAAGGNCTSPNYTSSDASGTDNLDPNDGHQYWWIDNDAWSGSHGPQSLYVCGGSNPTSSDSDTSWYAVSNQTDNQGQVETYPNTEYDVGGRATPSTETIGQYSSITSTFSEDYPRTGSWDAAYDMWTNNWGTETMIWNDEIGDPTYWNTQGTAVTIAGVNYEFVNLGSEYIFIMKNPESSGTVNILAVYQYEVANGLAKSSDVISQLEYGVEIEATNGNETFPMNGVTFNVS